MSKPLPSGNKMLDRALARSAAKQKAPAASVKKPSEAEPDKTKLSEQEIQHHVDILLEASKPDPTSKLQRLMNDSADITHKILVEKYKDYQQEAG